jgi:hypothetical protein
VVQYDIERIATDHPALLTGNLVACAVARCRSVSSSPLELAVECEKLPTAGTKKENCELQWQSASEGDADKAEKTWQERRLTEDAAVGVCAAVFAALKEGEIYEVTAHGTGADYWLDNRRAVLEVSGLKKGKNSSLVNRHKAKTKQMKQGVPFIGGKPGYVFVVAFGIKEANLSYHT